MKFLILVGDGMADEPIDELGGLTPLEKAHTPNMDSLARGGLTGLAETVPAAFHPGSDVANLSVFGYDPALCYTGRSPLEAASMGVELGPADVAFRLNLVTLVPHGGDLYMEDFSAGHISTDEARELIATLQNELGDETFQFYAGVSYRHLMVWRGGREDFVLTPPHDLTHQSLRPHVPRVPEAAPLMQITTSAQMLFKHHPVNLRREAAGQFNLAVGAGETAAHADSAGNIWSDRRSDLSRRPDQGDWHLCGARGGRGSWRNRLSRYQLSRQGTGGTGGSQGT